MLTVSVRIGGTGARYAAPSADQKKDFVYTALLYPDGGAPSGEPSVGERDGAATVFMFEKPPLAEGGTLTLEIFAFAKDTAEADPSKNAPLLTGTKSGLEAEGGRITIADPMTLTPNTAGNAPKGTVSLKVTVPDGCALELDGEHKDKFMRIGSSPVFTIQQDGDGIPASTYTLTFKVTKNSETLHAFADTINVLPGMLTDTWSGLEAGEALEVTEQKMSRTFYVRGSAPGWYSANGYSDSVYTPSDSNAGTFLEPFATIQKAVDTVIAANYGGDYTIYVDGTLTYGGSNANGMADFSALDRALNLRIKALSTTEKATLDAGGKSRVMCASPAPGGSLDLALERLVLTGGNSAVAGGKISVNEGTDDCGGICVNADCSFEMVGGEISGNTGSGALVLGTLKLDGVEVKDNTGTGISLFDDAGCEFEMREGVTVSGNKGGGIYVGTGDKLTMTGGEISGNSTSYGGGVYVNTNGSFDMTDGKITGNTATTSGAGVYMNTGGTFNMTGGTIGGATNAEKNTATTNGGGVYAYDSSCTFTMGGSAKVAADNDVYLSGSGSSVAKIQVAGTLTASSPVATITPSAYAEDRQVLSADGENIPKITDTICAKFALTDDPSRKEWRLVSNTTGGALEEFLHEIYVDGASGSDTNKGRQTSPLKTVAAAANKKPGTIYLRNTTSETERIDISVDTEILVWEGASEAKITRSSAFKSNTLIHIDSSATCKMNDIKVDGNNVELSINGGAIFNRGTLEITGGEITNCKTTGNGGAIYTEKMLTSYLGGKLMINGTKISGNTAYEGGGVYVGSCGTFIMNGGTIGGTSDADKNTATGNGGGVYVQGGSVYSSGTFTMNGGTITSNTAAREGGGVYVYSGGTFEMNDGTITGNTATSGSGNGVYGAYTPNGGTMQGD